MTLMVSGRLVRFRGDPANAHVSCYGLVEVRPDLFAGSAADQSEESVCTYRVRPMTAVADRRLRALRIGAPVVVIGGATSDPDEPQLFGRYICRRDVLLSRRDPLQPYRWWLRYIRKGSVEEEKSLDPLKVLKPRRHQVKKFARRSPAPGAVYHPQRDPQIPAITAIVVGYANGVQVIGKPEKGPPFRVKVGIGPKQSAAPVPSDGSPDVQPAGTVAYAFDSYAARLLAVAEGRRCVVIGPWIPSRAVFVQHAYLLRDLLDDQPAVDVDWNTQHLRYTW